jgi:MoaA/NifB/PqqE/SkfB family radical SAM enzyme
MSAELCEAKSSSDIADSGEISTVPILILNVHENCNCKCKMCDIWKRPAGAELTLERVAAYQSSIRSLNVRQVVLTGGEPLLHTHFRELCELLKQCDVRITLLSTGLLLQKRADVVADCVDEVIISLDGPEETHNAIRRIPRAYQLMGDGIATVKTARPHLPIHARSTIQSANFRCLRQTVAAARCLRCDSISFLAVDTTSQAFNRELVWPTGRQNEVGIASHEISYLEQEMELLIEQHATDIQDHFIVESPEKLRRMVSYFRERLGELAPRSPLCTAPWVSVVVEVDGSVRPCFFHPIIGDSTVLPLHEAINSPVAREFRRTLDIDHNPICQRCVCSLNYRQIPPHSRGQEVN